MYFDEISMVAIVIFICICGCVCLLWSDDDSTLSSILVLAIQKWDQLSERFGINIVNVRGHILHLHYLNWNHT